MYSPRISEALISRLYNLKKQLGKPMTQLVNEAISKYLEEQYEILNEKEKEGDSNGKNIKGDKAG